MTAATAPQSPNLVRDDRAAYLVWATDSKNSAAVLLDLFRKRKNRESAPANALLDGHVALDMSADKHIRRLRDLGGLLHFGQAAAVAAARRIKQQGGAA